MLAVDAQGQIQTDVTVPANFYNSHTHRVNLVVDGGSTETRPENALVNFIIKT